MAGFQKRFNVSLVVAREAYVMMVLAVFATTALCCAAQAQPPANTSAVLPADASLNEFKNSTAVTSVNDPGDAPEAPCPLAASDLAQADLLSVNSSCGAYASPKKQNLTRHWLPCKYAYTMSDETETQCLHHTVLASQVTPWHHRFAAAAAVRSQTCPSMHCRAGACCVALLFV